MTFLNDSERTQLISQHKRERDKRVCDRIKAVLLFDKGWSVAAIAEVLLLSEDAIRDHIAEYRDFQKLKPENGGFAQKLSIEHSDELVAHLRSPPTSMPKTSLPMLNLRGGLPIQFLVCAIGFNAMASPTKNPHSFLAKQMGNNNERRRR